MSNVLPLSRWKNHDLAERECFSSDDESDLEESSDDLPIMIPTRKPGQRKKEKPSLIIPKRDPAVRRSVIKRAAVEVPGLPPGPPPKRMRGSKAKPSETPSRI